MMTTEETGKGTCGVLQSTEIGGYHGGQLSGGAVLEVQAGPAGSPGSARPFSPAVLGVLGQEAEHEARGLLNAIGLLSHCLKTGGVTDVDAREWRLEIDKAQRRLEQLYASGLRRHFLSDSLR